MTREETQITWASAASKAVSAGASETSDAFVFNAGDWAAQIQVEANNNGTPASGDTVDVYILWDVGSVSDTAATAVALCVLDTYAVDPAVITVTLPTPAASGFRLHAANRSSGRSITVSAKVATLRGAIS